MFPKKKPLHSNSLLLLLLSLGHWCMAQPAGIANTYSSQKNIPKLVVDRVVIYAPEKEWLYSHHASIIHFKKELYSDLEQWHA